MLIKVKTFPQAKEEKIIKKDEDKFEVYVKEKAKEGKANERVLALLGRELKTKNLKIIKGARERSKIVRVDEK